MRAAYRLLGTVTSLSCDHRSIITSPPLLHHSIITQSSLGRDVRGASCDRSTNCPSRDLWGSCE